VTRAAPLLVLLAVLVAPTREARGATERWTIQVQGRARAFLVHAPDPLPPGRRLPVVLVFHGAGCDASSMVRATGFDALADREGFLVVYPEGIGGRFQTAAPRPGTPDDVPFVRALLAWLPGAYPVDPARVHATGFSNGAMFCYRLAAEMSDAIASIGPVAGFMASPGPRPASPVSVVHVHGTADDRVPLARVPETIRRWAAWNDCEPEARVERLEPAPRFVLTRRWHAGRRPGVDVGLYRVEGAGHGWPTEGGQWVTRTLWAFFASHPKVAASPPAR
jgi:polyhydroxybutyrate depolymerase